MGTWIFGLIVGVLICGFLPSDKMSKFHDLLIKVVTLGRAKIKEKLEKK
jgi:hypothetical protein